jgi:hypothetical protein
MKIILSLIISMWALSANAVFTNPFTEVLRAQGLFNQEVKPLALDWKVGESTQHNINMGFISGKMDTIVREETDIGFWMNQDVDLSFFGKQKIEIHINKSTGEIIEIRVDGQKQNPPEQGEQELVEMKEVEVTVPAGKFACVYLKILDKSSNQTSEAWINPEEVPVTGMIKSIQPGQFGNVEIVLTSFKDL